MPRWSRGCAARARFPSPAPICRTCSLRSKATTCCSAAPIIRVNAAYTSRRQQRRRGGADRVVRIAVRAGQRRGGKRAPARGLLRIAGIKPTSGRLPRTGHVPPAGGWIEALWQIGPMARTVGDLIAMMPILAGADGLDPTSPDMPLARSERGGYRRTASGGVRGGLRCRSGGGGARGGARRCHAQRRRRRLVSRMRGISK